jgi:hypothetical protein
MMREIKYRRHNLHSNPMKCTAALPYFLLDIPYMFVTGTIPSLAIIEVKSLFI